MTGGLDLVGPPPPPSPPSAHRTMNCLPPRPWPPAPRPRRPTVTTLQLSAAHRVRVAGPLRGNAKLRNGSLQHYRADADRVVTVPCPASEPPAALRNQKAAAYLAAGPINSKVTADAIAAST